MDARALDIVTRGVVVSAAAITPAHPDPAFRPPIPNERRVHELFVILEGRLYLCYLSGTPTPLGVPANAPVPPSASCFD